MIYAVLGIIGALAAWIYKQFNDLETLKRTAAQQKQGDELHELAKKIDDSNSKVSEEIQDYAKAKEDFNSKYGNSDGSGKPS